MTLVLTSILPRLLPSITINSPHHPTADTTTTTSVEALLTAVWDKERGLVEGRIASLDEVRDFCKVSIVCLILFCILVCFLFLFFGTKPSFVGPVLTPNLIPPPLPFPHTLLHIRPR